MNDPQFVSSPTDQDKDIKPASPPVSQTQPGCQSSIEDSSTVAPSMSSHFSLNLSFNQSSCACDGACGYRPLVKIYFRVPVAQPAIEPLNFEEKGDTRPKSLSDAIPLIGKNHLFALNSSVQTTPLRKEGNGLRYQVKEPEFDPEEEIDRRRENSQVQISRLAFITPSQPTSMQIFHPLSPSRLKKTISKNRPVIVAIPLTESPAQRIRRPLLASLLSDWWFDLAYAEPQGSDLAPLLRFFKLVMAKPSLSDFSASEILMSNSPIREQRVFLRRVIRKALKNPILKDAPTELSNLLFLKFKRSAYQSKLREIFRNFPGLESRLRQSIESLSNPSSVARGRRSFANAFVSFVKRSKKPVSSKKSLASAFPPSPFEIKLALNILFG